MQQIYFRNILILITLMLSSIALQAQSKKTVKADAFYQSGEMVKAAEYYKKALTKAKTRPEKGYITFQLGECYRRINQSKEAEKWYKQALRFKHTNPATVLYLADALRMNMNLEEAKLQYQEYIAMAPEDPRGELGLKAVNQVEVWMNNPTRYIVNNESFLNTRQADFAPAFRKTSDEIFLTSSREGITGSTINTASGELFTDIFIARLDKKGKWSIPQALAENINTEFDEGTPAFNSKGTVLYFTRCQLADSVNACAIYSSKRNGNDWATPVLEFMLEDTTVSYGHPCISPDELTLYFVAEMKGGKGGKDIWKVTRSTESGTWSAPTNLGDPVNTPGDEMFPYVKPDGTFYFASNYHIGVGGLDIFKLQKNEDGKLEVVNLGIPINSPADDFGIIFNPGEEKGFFSSTRSEGSKGSDDIWSFELPPLIFKLTGEVIDENTEQKLPGVKVKLTGSNGTVFEATTDDEGKFNFKLQNNTDYIVITTKENYLNGKARETTKGLNMDKTINVVIPMAPFAKPIELPNILYDFNDWKLRPESMVSLDLLVETLKENPKVVIELASHTDNRGTDEKNDTLSFRRANSVVEYLISKGIQQERLQAKGYGEKNPKMVDAKLRRQYDFLAIGKTLDEAYINSLPEEYRETAHQINRRTEFKVISSDFKP